MNLDKLKKVLLPLYIEYIYEALDKYVKSTTNTYDDSALVFVDKFIRDFLS